MNSIMVAYMIVKGIERRNNMIKTTICLHRIGKRLFGRECDANVMQ